MIEQLNIHVHFLDISLSRGYNQAKTYKQHSIVSKEGTSEVTFVRFLLVKYPMNAFVFKLF